MGAIPTFLSGTAYNASELMALRFFIGILGGSFVPCQVWSTGFFDKNIVGTANAFTAGFGNSGGGITYFLMPAIFDSLVAHQHLSAHVAWRVSFVVPGICITAVGLGLLLLCPDTPTGKWSNRHLAAQQNLAAHGITGTVVDAPGSVIDKKTTEVDSSATPPSDSAEKMQFAATGERKKSFDREAQLSEQSMLDTARGEVVIKPTWKASMKVIFSPQTLVTASCYFCSFGAELAINSILGAYYLTNFKILGQKTSGNWAAMFGLLNIAFRPIGGLMSDFLYRKTGTVWAKKIWLHSLAILTGAFLLAIGLTNSHHQSTMFGLVAGMAFFLEAGNGANYSLVPHVHPHANGIVSGCTGAAGNLGGIIFSIIFRFDVTGKTSHYGKTVWIIGVITIAVNLAVCWIRPIPKGQIGGH
jgi:MFS transporter, NNP family, nitrate/nitrite transporter